MTLEPDQPYTADATAGQPDFVQAVVPVSVEIDNMSSLQNLILSGDTNITNAVLQLLQQGGLSAAQAQTQLNTIITQLNAGNQAILQQLLGGFTGQLQALAQVSAQLAQDPYAFDTIFLNEAIRDTANHFGTSPSTLLAARSGGSGSAGGILTGGLSGVLGGGSRLGL